MPVLRGPQYPPFGEVPSECVKCGSDKGFGGPAYLKDEMARECMLWSCNWCGYQVYTATKDAKPREPVELCPICLVAPDEAHRPFCVEQRAGLP